MGKLNSAARPEFDLAGVVRATVMVGLMVAAATTLYHNAVGHVYGWDFHGIWNAAQTMSHGRNPYPAAHAHQLRKASNPYVLPPLIGLVSIPLGKLPFWAAILIWNLVAVACLCGALVLLGVKDLRVYLLALCSFPFVSSLVLGQPDGVFALLAALAWRYRAAWWSGLAVGILVAAKLLMWPLIVWLVLRRRFSAAVAAVASGIVITLATWALIDFAGFTTYPKLLSADARGFETDSHSVVALAIRLGTGRPAALVLAVLCAVAVLAGLLRVGKTSDFTGFLAAIVAGLLVSPLMWSHYLVLLFVPMAIVWRRASLAWLATALFWVSPSEPPASVWQVAAVLVLLAGIAFAAARERRPGTTAIKPRAELASHSG
jgi:hypothetical protein